MSLHKGSIQVLTYRELSFEEPCESRQLVEKIMIAARVTPKNEESGAQRREEQGAANTTAARADVSFGVCSFVGEEKLSGCRRA